MCENLRYESVYFKELHNCKNTIDRQYTAGAAVVVSTITSQIILTKIAVSGEKKYSFVSVQTVWKEARNCRGAVSTLIQDGSP